jgi:hypothetical protein
LCALSDEKCGTDSCVYDSRNASSFSFYCASKCTVGDAARCPSGYDCVAPGASCSNGVTGVCAQREGFGCDPKVVVSAGKFFEGPAGELYHFAGQSTVPPRATLSVRSGNTFKSVQSWDGDIVIRAIVRNGDSLLLVTSDSDVLVKDGKATAKKRSPSPSVSYDAAYGVGKDGAFVLLNTTGGSDSFAALSRRGDDGAWTEVGPTRQRVTRIKSLTTGFLAICQKALCSSADGETFTPVELPPGVTLEVPGQNGGAATIALFAAAGASTTDFHFATGGRLFHHRKGVWVEEGPKAKPAEPGNNTGGYVRDDILRSFSDGTIVFHTWVPGTTGSGSGGYTTYVYGDDCWSFSPGGNLDNTDLVKGPNGNTFVYADSFDKQLCSVAAR